MEFNLSKNKKIWKGIKITQDAMKQILFLSSRLKNKKLKLEVKKSGCAGFSYVMKWIQYPEKSDLLFTYEKQIYLYVPIKSIKYLDGTEIQYVQDGINKVFKFNNPKSQNICGCGESFGIE